MVLNQDQNHTSLMKNQELFEFLQSCSSIGYGKARRDVMNTALKRVAEKGLLRNDCISDG